MPSSLAFVLTICFVVFLFARERRQHAELSGALWLPLLWMLVVGTRFVSEWFNIGAPASTAALEDGSPIDRVVFLGLIVGGVFAWCGAGFASPKFVGTTWR